MLPEFISCWLALDPRKAIYWRGPRTETATCSSPPPNRSATATSSTLPGCRSNRKRAAPTTGSGQQKIFVSPNGTGAVVAWENGSSLAYVETDPATGAWSETFNLQLDDELSRSEAYSILRERARSLE